MLQPYDSAIEDEHEELVRMYEALGAEKSDLAERDDEDEDEDMME